MQKTRRALLRQPREELDRESAAREVLVRVLVSPNFLFKAETLPPPELADASTTEDCRSRPRARLTPQLLPLGLPARLAAPQSRR
jgi:hypothetical protein